MARENHDRDRELMSAFTRRGRAAAKDSPIARHSTGLAYGWIDGVRRRVDDASYTKRFSPRKASSAWSAVNERRVEELHLRPVRMRPPGPGSVSERRSGRKKSGRYSYEQRPTASSRPRKNVRVNKQGVGVFRGPAARLSPDGHLVCRQRREGRDAARRLDDADRAVRCGPPPRARHGHEDATILTELTIKRATAGRRNRLHSGGSSWLARRHACV